MKILIAADMEGITGVVHGDQTTPGQAEYERFRRVMTGDVNAAIRGAFEGGAGEVVVSDGHGDGRNILIEELDPRARLNSGSSAPFCMVQGIDSGVDGVLFVGYHARVGTPNAILDHVWSSVRVASLRLNGQAVGEIGLNAALCGHFGAPVLMISGDQTACAQAMELLGALETAVVKQATGFASAECLPLKIAYQLIREAASRAGLRLKAGNVPEPFVVAEPVRVTIEFLQPEFADRAVRLPGAKRLDGRRIEFVFPDMAAAHAGFRAAVKQAFD